MSSVIHQILKEKLYPKLNQNLKQQLYLIIMYLMLKKVMKKTKEISRKKKINQQQQQQQTKKPILKTNNEETKKDKPSKTNHEQSVTTPTPITTKKKITITKTTTEKKKVTVNSTKPTSKITNSSTGQKRPSTDEPNESTKKLKFDDEKSKPTAIEEQQTLTVQTESENTISDKPSIIITSPTHESSTNVSKIDEPSTTETNPQTTTPTKFGIVFTSHHRHSTTPPSSSIRTKSTETSKNNDEHMDDDNELSTTNNTVNKNEQSVSNTNTLKPPTTTQQPLSDDETLNPETMQLSDLIGATRREGTKSVPSRSTTKTTGKGKRTTRKETVANKRQQTKTNSKINQTNISNEKESEPIIDSTLVPATEPSPVAIVTTTTTKRLSTNESTSGSSPTNDKEVKRLRKSTDEATSQSQIKLEPIDNVAQNTTIPVKEETIEPLQPLPSSSSSSVIASEITKQETLPLTSSTTEQSQVTSMETDQVPTASSSSSIITSTQSPVITTTTTSTTPTTETENTIKSLYSTIQISQQSMSKTSNLEKSSPIIAPISKETLPIVEHQPKPIQTTSILPPHVSTKSSATFSMIYLFI